MAPTFWPFPLGGGHRELETRKPRLSLRLEGVFLLRFAARRLDAVLFQLPPRLTRLASARSLPDGS